MKKVSFLVLLCAVWNGARAQSVLDVDFNVQVDYKMSYQPDSTNPSVREEYMELLVNDKFSVFQSKNKGRLDSMHYAQKRGKGVTVPEGFWSANRATFHYQIRKSGDSIITRDEYRLRKNFEYHYYFERQDSFDWVIKEDTATIAGLVCQKAEVDFGGRRWAAWLPPRFQLRMGHTSFAVSPD